MEKMDIGKLTLPQALEYVRLLNQATVTQIEGMTEVIKNQTEVLKACTVKM